MRKNPKILIFSEKSGGNQEKSGQKSGKIGTKIGKNPGSIREKIYVHVVTTKFTKIGTNLGKKCPKLLKITIFLDCCLKKMPEI